MRRSGAMLVVLAVAVTACAVDPARQPRTYLLQAQQAIAAHDAARALASLDRAEVLWTGGTGAYIAPWNYDIAALRDMGTARAAVEQGRWDGAARSVRAALSHPSVLRPG